MFIEPYSQGYNLFKLIGTAVIIKGEQIRWRNGNAFIPDKNMLLKFLSEDVFEVYEKTEYLVDLEKTGKLTSVHEDEIRRLEDK